MSMHFGPTSAVALTADAIERILPRGPAPTTSDKYVFLDTREVVKDMKDLGYEAVSFSVSKARTIEGFYAPHMVDFRPAGDLAPHNIKGTRPRLIFINSYDGSRRAQVMAGLFRFVCLNGMVIGDTAADASFIHMGADALDLRADVAAAAEVSGQSLEVMAQARTIPLSPAARTRMAERAVAIRFGEGEVGYTPPANVALMPRRRDDTGHDLWTTWNVLQENLMKGGVVGVNPEGKTRVLRPISQVTKSLRVNTDLWGLLEEGLLEAA